MRLFLRLTLAQVPLLAAVACVAGVSIHELTQLGESSRRILTENYRSVLATQRMTEAVERLDSAALAHVAGHGAALEGADEHLRTFRDELEIERSNLTEPGESTAVEALDAAWTRYAAALARLRHAPDDAAARLYFDDVEPPFRDVKARAEEILALNQGAMVRKSDAARDVAERTVVVLLSVAALALAVGGISSALLTARLLRPLATLARASARIAEDDLTARADAAGSDEIAAVAREFNRMAEALARFRNSTLGQMERARATAQAAVDCVPHPVLVLARGNELLAANPAGRALLGDAGAGLGALAPELRAEIERVRAAVERTRAPFTPDDPGDAVRVPLPEGERWWTCRGVPLPGQAGAQQGTAFVLEDVTHLRRLRRLHEEGVAIAAHALRTPLTSLHMAIHLCGEGRLGPLTEQQATLMAAAREDCERLRATVDELLELARLRDEAGGGRYAPVSVAELLRRSADVHAEAAARAGVRVTVTAPDEPLRVVCDAARLQPALDDLVANALRFAPRGSVVELRARGSGDAALVEVEDAGPGIPAEFRERVFERFFQVPETPQGGSGLGLWIARDAVRAHGGELTAHSGTAGGALLRMSLPRA